MRGEEHGAGAVDDVGRFMKVEALSLFAQSDECIIEGDERGSTVAIVVRHGIPRRNQELRD
jgi:hypothetical protein